MIASGIYAFDDFELDMDARELKRAGKSVTISSMSVRLLGVLVERAGQVITKSELFDRVWDGRAVSENVLTVAMTRLRKVLDRHANERSAIVNVHGRGYRFVRDVAHRPSQRSEPGVSELSMAPSAPFVGRDAVLEHLRGALQQASLGRGSLVVLSGEAGIGKTRVAEELECEARRREIPVAWGRCREVGDTPPLWPFAELLREIATTARLDRSDPRLASAIPQLVRLVPEWACDARTEEAPNLAQAKLGRKHRVFDAIARVLALASERAACVLVLDDLHRADALSLELLHYLVDDIARSRLLLLATLRSTGAPTPEALTRVLGHRNTARIALSRLSEDDVAEYITAVLGSAESATQHAVFHYSEGNPFFMSELARQLRLRPLEDPAQLSVPDAALDVVRQRVAELPEEVRGVLACAAVIGRTFSLALLQAVMGSDTETLMASLDAAIASEIVAPKRDARTEFVFGHELLRAVLYDALAPAERRQWHLRVGKALEQRAPSEPVAPADLAYHAREALPLGDLSKTIRRCVEAATAAAQVFAYADAARSLQHALETLDIHPTCRPGVREQLLLHQALFTRAHSTRAFLPLITRVVQLAREHALPDVLARAAMLHDPYPGMPALPGSVTLFEDALALLSAQSETAPLRAAMSARLAASPPAAYSAALSGELLARADALAASSADPLDAYSACIARVYLTSGAASAAESKQRLDELARLIRRQGVMHGVPAVILEMHRALQALQDGELASMQVALDRGTTRCRDLDAELLWHFERFGAVARWNGGAQAAAGHTLKHLHERARSQGIIGSEVFCAYDEAVLFGATVLNAPRLRDAFAPADEDRPNLWALKLRGLAASGALSDARDGLMRVSATQLADLPADRDYLGSLGALAHVAVAVGAREHAEALYALLQPFPRRFAAHVSFVCEGSVSQLLGMLANTLGWRERASAHMREAIELCRDAGLTASERSAELALQQLQGPQPAAP